MRVGATGCERRQIGARGLLIGLVVGIVAVILPV